MTYKMLCLFLSGILLAGLSSISQTTHTPIIQAGTIEYEKRTNIDRILDSFYMKDGDASRTDFARLYKQTGPKIKVSYYNLSFDTLKSSYQLVSPVLTGAHFLDKVVEDNIVETHFREGISFSKKQVFENVYTIKDSLRKVVWKITDEYRDIAGFQCRRANGLVLDSVYVVAFYTDQIVVRGGPESFWGLPGMIMGVVLPHEYTSWYATKVYLEQKRHYDLGRYNVKTIRRYDLERLITEMDVIKQAGYYGQFLYRRILL